MANCNKQRLNITCGTDVELHDTLIFDGETFDPALSVGITANLVSSLGKRTALEVEVADGGLIIYVPWEERNAGYYGLEVTGTCNSKKWATYADSLIHYTRATEMGVAEVTIESDYYDITQVVGYRYSTSPINAVTATVDDQVGTPSVEYQYDGKNINFDFHNLKGQPFTYADLTPAQKAELKGEQGDSAVYDPSSPDAPDFVMANTTGDSTTKAMTQKAVTDELEKIDVWEETDFSISGYPTSFMYINGSVWGRTSSPGSNSNSCVVVKIDDTGILPFHPGDELEVVAKSTASTFVRFLSAEETFVNKGTIHFATDGNTPAISAGTKATIIVPEDAAWVIVKRGNAGASFPEHIYITKRKSYYKDKIDGTVGNESYALNGIKLCNKNSGDPLDRVLALADSAWSVSDFIPCAPNDVIHFGNGGHESNTSCIHFYNASKSFVGNLASNDYSSNYGDYTIPSESLIRYVRLSYKTNGIVVVNDEVKFRADTANETNDVEIESLFIGQTAEQEYSGTGAGSTSVTINLGHLKEGARHRLVLQNPEDLTLFQLRGVTPTFYIHYGTPNIPVPEYVDFTARENEHYEIIFRAASGTSANFTLLAPGAGIPEQVAAQIETNTQNIATINTSLAKQDFISNNLHINSRWNNNAGQGSKSGSDPVILRLFHFSDIHGDNNAAAGLLSIINKYTNDGVLNTGDVRVTSADYTTEDDLTNGIPWYINTGLAAKSMFTVGNHDIPEAIEDSPDRREQTFDALFANFYSGWGVTLPTGYNDPESIHYKATYWHKDFQNSKIRLIGLDCMHYFGGVVDPVTGETTTQPNSGGWPSKSQELWFIEKLNETLTGSGSTVEGWKVLIACHYSLDNFSGDNAEWDDTTHRFIVNESATGGRVMLANGVEQTRWNRGASYTAATKLHLRNTNGSVNNFGNIINAWMTNENYADNFIAWISGHRHSDYLYYPTQFPNVLCIGINQAGERRATRMVYHGTEHGIINALFIDPVLNIIKVVRFGNTIDQWLVHRTYLCYNYATKKVISEG